MCRLKRGDGAPSRSDAILTFLRSVNDQLTSLLHLFYLTQDRLNHFLTGGFLRYDRITQTGVGPHSFDLLDQEEGSRRDFTFGRCNSGGDSLRNAAFRNHKRERFRSPRGADPASSGFGDFDHLFRQFAETDRNYERFGKSFGESGQEHQDRVDDSSGHHRAFAHAGWSPYVCSHGGGGGIEEGSFPGDENHHELLVQARVGILLSLVPRDNPCGRDFGGGALDDRGGSDRLDLCHDYLGPYLLYQEGQVVCRR